MKPKLTSSPSVRPHLGRRLGLFFLLSLAIVLGGTPLSGSRQAVCAAEADSESPSQTQSEESAAEATREISDSTDKSSSKKASSKKREQAKADTSPSEGEAESAADSEVKAAEAAKAKADEEAGAEVELEDDSEEMEPTENVEIETPPIVEEPVTKKPEEKKRVIGATATIMEKKSELLFKARVDTGAKSCSLHIEDMKIENESENMADNIGKVVSFNIKNGNQESHWLKAKIAGYVIIKTSNEADDRKRRYKVPLTFRYKDFEKTVLVTLNNREHMEFPLLLGRNFLKDDFVVDVTIESND